MSFYSKLSHRLPRLLRKGRVPVVLLVAAAIFLFSNSHSAFLVGIPGLAKLADSLSKTESSFLDFNFLWRGPIPANPEIVIIGINTTSQQRSNFKEEDLNKSEALRLMTDHDFPWNRKVYALLIEKLANAGVKAIAFDLLFVRELEGDPELRAVIEKYRDRIIVAESVSKESLTAGTGNKQAMLEPNKNVLPENRENLIGMVTYHLGTDDVARRVNYQTSAYQEQGGEYLGAELDPEIISFAPLIVQKVTGKALPRKRDILINFQGPERTYPYLPIEE